MSLINETVTIARHHAGNAYLKLWQGALILIALVIIMWILNLIGAPIINLLIGMVGMLGIAFITFSPKAVFIFFGLGAVVAELKDEDITQGTVKGVAAQYRVFLAVAYAFMGLAGLLATWSFRASPMAFWMVAFFGTFLLIMNAYYNTSSGKRMHQIGTTYALAVIILSLWSTLYGTPVYKNVNAAIPAILTPSKPAAPVAPKVIPELCQNSSGGELPGCEVIMLTTSELRKTLPALACYAFNPGKRALVRVEKDAKGEPTGDVLIKSKSGADTPVGLYKVKSGETINGFTCT